VTRNHTEVGRDVGVVKELIGKRDHGLEPIVLDDPQADIRHGSVTPFARSALVPHLTGAGRGLNPPSMARDTDYDAS
jgi:hypothetical protein